MNKCSISTARFGLTDTRWCTCDLYDGAEPLLMSAVAGFPTSARRRRPGNRNDFLIPNWPACTLHIVFRWKFHLPLHYSEASHPVTWISGKITIRARLLYRRYTATMAGFLLAQATGWPLMPHCNSPVPQAIPPPLCFSGFQCCLCLPCLFSTNCLEL